MERKQTLAGLRAMKLICVFLLFWWHSPLKNPSVDIGARSCEVFFVISGFLVAYQHADRQKDVRWKDSFSYLKDKICKMWPLHFCCFLMCVLLNGFWGNDLEKPLIAFLNIFLLQAWVNDSTVFFSYNGASWFLSAILFCYFMSPLLLKGLKTKRSAIFSFAFIAFLRIFAEYLQLHKYNVYVPVSMHAFPLIRAMEFYCGMTLYRFREYFEKFLTRHKLENNVLVFSLGEGLALFVAVWLIITKNDCWMRGYYVLLFCCVIFVFSFDKGIISMITNECIFSRNYFAKALALLSGFEFEIFMLHQVMIAYSSYLISHYSSDNIWIVTYIALVTTIATAWIWKHWIASHTTEIMRRMFKKAEYWLGYSI